MLIRSRLPLWVVFGLILAAYIGVGQAGFVWDDHALLEHNTALDAPTFTRIWLRDIWCCTGTNNTGYYRPLLTLTFLLDRTLFGISPAASHVHSLLWHLATVGFVAALLRPRVGPERSAAAALIFGLHPIQSEAVLWIAARNDLMVAAGVVATLWALDSHRRALAGLLAFAACLSKESAFLLPAVAWVWRRAWGERLERSDGLALGLGLGAALALRAQATLGGLALDQADNGFSAASAVTGVVKLLGWVAWPWPLTSTASLYQPTSSLGNLAAIGVTLLAFVALVYFGRARAAWLLVLAAIVLAPSTMGARWYGNIGERYLYLPLFGFAAAVAATVPARPWAAAGLATASLAALAALHVRVPEWADEEALFTAAVVRAPDSYAWNLLGVELLRQRRLGEATAAFDAAIAASPLQRRACRHVIEAADPVLDDALFLERAARWTARGCAYSLTFDGELAMAQASRGAWDAAAATVALMRRSDDKRRDQVVRAALAMRAGDLDTLSTLAFAWPSGPSNLLDQVSYLTQNRENRDTAPTRAP